MRLAKRISVVSLAIVVTAGIAGVAVVANADERPTPHAASAPEVAELSDVPAEENVQGVTALPDPAVLNDLLSTQLAAMAPNTATEVETLAGPGALPNICSKRTTAPILRTMVINAYCYWAGRGFPKKRVHIRTAASAIWTGGGVFQNKEGRLPRGGNHHYLEFDLAPHLKNQNRGAMRIVIDMKSGMKYFTLDHYETFQPFVAD